MSSGLTTRAGVSYPVNSDNAAVASDIQSIAQFIDSNVALFVQAASQPASPIKGQIWWCTSTTAVDANGNSQYGFNWYDGNNWYNVTEQMFMVGPMAPLPTFSGLLWYDTSTANGNFKYWSGTAWVDIIPATTTNGQVLTSSSTGIKWVTPSYLPSSESATNGQVLTIVSGTPAWSSVSSVPTTSGIINGYVLTNASGTPTWQAVSSSANATVNLTAQSAAKSVTTLFTPVNDGLYQIAYYAKVTTAATTSSTIGPFTVTSTDPDGNTVVSVGESTSQNSTTNGFINGIIPVYAKGGTAIQYALSYASSGATAMAYDLYIVVSGTVAPVSTGTVASFNGRTGAVTPATGDYNSAQLTYTNGSGSLYGSDILTLRIMGAY